MMEGGWPRLRELSSGSAPEPVTPEPAATERPAAEPQAPAAEPQALMVPELAVPELAVPELAVPEPAEPVADERAVTDPDPEPPAAGSDEHPGQARRDQPARRRHGDHRGPGGSRGRRRPGRRDPRLPAEDRCVLPASPPFSALRAGDCIDSSPNGLSVTVLSCASPHHAEVFATFSLAGSSWPGSAAVQQQVASGCQNKIAGYLNPALLNAGLTQEYIYPDQTAWKAGVRTAVCEVSSSTGPLTGSVRSAS